MHAAILQYLPPGTEPHVADLLGGLPLHVRLARPRRTKLGDHRPPGRGWSVHRITINDDLNPYAFMTTLLHEIAHAAAWERNRPLRRLLLFCSLRPPLALVGDRHPNSHVTDANAG
jgi:hypothetical protein